MKKFKIGDKVRIKQFDKKPPHWNIEMKKWPGRTVTIKNADKCFHYDYYIKENIWGYYESDFEPFYHLPEELFEI